MEGRRCVRTRESERARERESERARERESERAPDDSALFSRLVEATRPRLLRILARFRAPELRGSVDPEDLAQETCLNAWRRRAQFHGTDAESFLRWILAIARGTFANLRRTARRDKRLATSISVADVDSVADDRPRQSSDSPEVRAQDRELRDLLVEIVRGPNQDAFSLIAAIDLGGESVRSLAGARRVPASTVRSRLARERDELRRLVASRQEAR